MTDQERKDKQRLRFEEVVKNEINTSRKFNSYSLAPMIINDVFHHYMDPDTDNLWIGYQVGQLIAQRDAKNDHN